MQFLVANDQGQIQVDCFRQIEYEVLNYKNYLTEVGEKKSPKITEHKTKQILPLKEIDPIASIHSIIRFKDRVCNNVDSNTVALLFRNIINSRKMDWAERYPYFDKARGQWVDSVYVPGHYQGKKFFLVMNEDKTQVCTIIDSEIMSRVRSNRRLGK